MSPIGFWKTSSGLSNDLREQVVAAAGGEYDYPNLRKSLRAIVPKVKKEEDHNNQSTSRPSFNRQWKPRNHPRQVNATTEHAEQKTVRRRRRRWMRWARKSSRGS